MKTYFKHLSLQKYGMICKLNFRRLKPAATWFLIGVFVLILPQLCWSEEVKQKSYKALDLGQIVVTPTKTARSIYEVPSSVSIITAEDIEESDARDLTDLLCSMEGAVVYDASGVGTQGRLNMRGFWGGMSTHNLVLVDGIPINSAKDKLVDWNMIPLETIERIEVVRGPASALYGDTAFAGAINIITKEGTVVPQTKVYSSYGSFKTQNHRVNASGTSGNMKYFLNISRKSTDGFREHADYDDIHLTKRLDFSFDPTFNAKLSLGYDWSMRGCLNWALTESQLAENREQARPGTENDKGKNTKSDLGITLHKDIGKIQSLESKFYIRDEEEHSFGTTSGGATREYVEDEEAFGLISRYEVNPKIFKVDNSLIFGVDLERNNFRYNEYNAPGQIRTTARANYVAVRKRSGLYIQDEVKISEPWSLILGMRYDESDYDFINHPDNTRSKTKSLSATSPKFGTVYVYKENSSIYATIARAFRTPTLAQMFTYSSSNPDLNPEESDNYEVGLHHQLGDFLAGTLSLYRIEIDDEIWYDSVAREYKNYGETLHKGLESSLNFELDNGWNGFANYTYTKPKNESGTYKGKYLAQVPKHMGNLGLKGKADNGVGANLFLNWVGRSYLDSANSEQLAAYATVDGKISYEGKIYSISLSIDNLLDKDYYLYGFKSSPTAAAKFSPAPRRTWTLGLSAKF